VTVSVNVNTPSASGTPVTMASSAHRCPTVMASPGGSAPAVTSHV
jgi:hypothetical protein